MPALVESTLFVIRVIKSLAVAPLNEWANSYEFQTTSPVGLGELNTLASSVVLFEKAIHSNTVAFRRCVVSSWAPDSVPYDPEVFMTIGLVGNGGVGPVVDPLALNQCLSVARNPSAGRLGHLFFRGVLWEGNVEAPNGVSVLTDAAAMDDLVQEALTTSEFGSYIGAEHGPPLRLVMINKNGTQIREVMSLTAQGVTTLPTDHAWFNRTPAGPPS